MTKTKKEVNAKSLFKSLQKKFHNHFVDKKDEKIYHLKKTKKGLIRALQAILDGKELEKDKYDKLIETLSPVQLCDSDSGIISQRLVRHLRGYDGSPQCVPNFYKLWFDSSPQIRNYVYTMMYYMVDARFKGEPNKTNSSKKKKKSQPITPKPSVIEISDEKDIFLDFEGF